MVAWPALLRLMHIVALLWVSRFPEAPDEGKLPLARRQNVWPLISTTALYANERWSCTFNLRRSKSIGGIKGSAPLTPSVRAPQHTAQQRGTNSTEGKNSWQTELCVFLCDRGEIIISDGDSVCQCARSCFSFFGFFFSWQLMLKCVSWWCVSWSCGSTVQAVFLKSLLFHHFVLFIITGSGSFVSVKTGIKSKDFLLPLLALAPPTRWYQLLPMSVEPPLLWEDKENHWQVPVDATACWATN